MLDFMGLSDVMSKVLVTVLSAGLIGALVFIHKRWVKPVLAIGHLAMDVAAIKKEMTTNGGSSLKDQIAAIRFDVAAVQTMLTLVEARQRGLIASLPRAHYETDEHFDWINVNGAMEKLTGVGFARLERKRWVSLIHEDDRDDVMREIQHMVADKRGAMVSFRFSLGDEDVPVRLDASPVYAPGAVDRVICWSGSISRHDERRLEERRTV